MTAALVERLDKKGPKRMLALDGGGIRGLITIEVLAAIEATLRERTKNEKLVLADWFDYVAGTSTGAILATLVSLGVPTDQIRAFYVENGAAMFDKASLVKRFRYKFEDDLLREKLRSVLKEKANSADDPTLGTDALQTLLMVVLRNATTDSPWTVSNNPRAKYCLRDERRKERGDCNLDLPLWQIVRASTAAPVYFPPEHIKLGPKPFVFVDGGITPYNNPAFALFQMATLAPYNVRWKTGAGEILLVSVGTGLCPETDSMLEASDMNLLYNAGSIPSALMYASLNQQDMLCRAFGRCHQPGEALGTLDREIGDLVTAADGTDPSPYDRLFTYARYNAELTRNGLARLGIPRGTIRVEDVRKLDSIEHMDDLTEIGRRVGATVRAEHFGGFVQQD